jgi:hypothetical protein
MTMSSRFGSSTVAWLSGSAFLAVFGGLALQLHEGRDPAISTAFSAAPSRPLPRRVLVRRIVERRVVVRVIPAPEPIATGSGVSDPSGGTSSAGSSPAPSYSAAPATSYSAAPVPAAAAPAPVAAPAPAAPVTRSS